MSVDLTSNLICFFVFECTECIEAGLEDAWGPRLNQCLPKSLPTDPLEPLKECDPVK